MPVLHAVPGHTEAVLKSLRALVIQSSAPAPRAPSPWVSDMGAIKDNISQCTFLEITFSAENPHADGNAAPGARPRFRPPRRRDPHATSPAYEQWTQRDADRALARGGQRERGRGIYF